MKDFITSQERLSFNDEKSKWEQPILNILSIVITYFLMIQIINSLGGA